MTRILVWSRQAEQIQKSEKRGSTVFKRSGRNLTKATLRYQADRGA